MAIRKIVQDTEFLRKSSKPVTEFDERLHELLDDMAGTLDDVGGIGLAAVQVGVLYRVCLIQVGGAYLELVNPEIISTKGEKKGEEGCLSLPKQWLKIARPTKVTVRAYDRHGNPFTRVLQKLHAVCACHEIDHLNGVLMTDREGELS